MWLKIEEIVEFTKFFKFDLQHAEHDLTISGKCLTDCRFVYDTSYGTALVQELI